MSCPNGSVWQHSLSHADSQSELTPWEVSSNGSANHIMCAVISVTNAGSSDESIYDSRWMIKVDYNDRLSYTSFWVSFRRPCLFLFFCRSHVRVNCDRNNECEVFSHASHFECLDIIRTLLLFPVPKISSQ